RGKAFDPSPRRSGHKLAVGVIPMGTQPVESHVKSPYTGGAQASERPVRSRLNATYDWKPPELEKVKLTPDLIREFLGAEIHLVWAWFRPQANSQITQEYSTLETWSAALSAEWSWSSVNVSSADGSRHVQLDFDRTAEQIRATVDMPGTD